MNVTAKEVIYLLNSFNAAQAYYRLHTNTYDLQRGDQIILSSYRKNLLSHKKVQAVWKNIIKYRMLEETPFTLAVDNFIANHNS